MTSANSIRQAITVDFLVGNEEALKFTERLNSTFERSQHAINGAIARTNTFAKSMNGLNNNVIKFNGNMLSLLFMGMEMQKVFGGALKSIFDGYKQIIQESDNFNKLTTQLSANWEFFKFQLADALANSPLFRTMIEFAITLLKFFQQLPTPVKELIGWLLIIGLVIGTLSFLTGFWGLALASIFNIFTGTTVAAAIAKLVAMEGGIWGAVAASAVWLLTVIAVIGAFVLIGALIKQMGDSWAEANGVMMDSWTDYVKFFVTKFVEGIVNLGLSLLQIPLFFVDMFANVLEIAYEFGKLLADIIIAALTPGKTISEEWKKFKDDVVNEFTNPNEYFSIAAVQGLKNNYMDASNDFLKEWVTEGQMTVNSDSNGTNTSTGITTQPVIVLPTLDDLKTQGYLTDGQLNEIRDITNNGN